MKFVRLFPFENDPIAIQRIGKVEKLHERVKYMVGTKAAQLANGYHLGFILMLVFAIIGFCCSFFLPSAKEEHK